MFEKYITDYNRLLEGKKVFITTAARGIGKSIAVLFARQGAEIYFAGRNEAYVRAAEEELQRLNPACRGYVCDLALGEQSEAAATQALRDSGGFHVLVCTVGVNCHCTVEDFRDEDMARLIETNYLSGLRFARRFAASLRKNRGCIVNISSIHSQMTQPTNMIYAGTKGGHERGGQGHGPGFRPGRGAGEHRSPRPHPQRRDAGRDGRHGHAEGEGSIPEGLRQMPAPSLRLYGGHCQRRPVFRL